MVVEQLPERGRVQVQAVAAPVNRHDGLGLVAGHHLKARAALGKDQMLYRRHAREHHFAVPVLAVRQVQLAPRRQLLLGVRQYVIGPRQRRVGPANQQQQHGNILAGLHI